jgi:hypothetical protein
LGIRLAGYAARGRYFAHVARTSSRIWAGWELRLVGLPAPVLVSEALPRARRYLDRVPAAGGGICGGRGFPERLVNLPIRETEMPLDFSAGRAHYDAVQNGIVIDARDGAKHVPVVIEKQALADFEGVSNVSPGSLVSIYRSHSERINSVISTLYSNGVVDARHGLRVTSKVLNGVRRKP